MEQIDNEENFPMLDWLDRHQLFPTIRAKLFELSKIISGTDKSDELLDEAFHAVARSMFHWNEGRKPLQDMDCAVQRFLVVLSLNKNGEGFINVRL
jgi:hypothetical protein